MAGADTKVSQLTEASDLTGGYGYVILPDGGGGWDSYQFPMSLLATTSDYTTESVTNQSSTYNFAISAGSKLEFIEFEWQSGSPKIKVGTNPGGDELSLAELPVPSSDYLHLTLERTMKTSQTVYITISDGVVNFKYQYRSNWF